MKEKVLISSANDTMHSTTIKLGDKLFKLVTNHYNGNHESEISIFTENGWKRVYCHHEIKGLVNISHLDSKKVMDASAFANYNAMLIQVKKVFV